MADEDYEREGDEGEEWFEPEDVDNLQDGPTTIFVGGFSKYKTINDALEAITTSNDQIIVLNSFDADVEIDATRFAGVTIIGATPYNTIPPKPLLSAEEREELEQEDNNADEIDEEEEFDEYGDPKKKPRPPKVDTTTCNVSIFGKLTLTYSDPLHITPLPTGFPIPDEEEEEDDGANENDDGDGDDDKSNKRGRDTDGNDNDDTSEAGDKKVTAPHANILTIKNLTFTRGIEMNSQTSAIIEDCGFGIRTHLPDHVTTVKVNALSKGEFIRCRFYGGVKSSIYCYPASRCKFTDSDVIGTVPNDENTTTPQKRPRGYVAPPPPPPVPPLTVTSATGILSDDSSCTFDNMDISNFGIGLYCIGGNRSLSFRESRVMQIQTVGLLCEQGFEGKLHEVVVTLCGRECAVLGSGHPTVRDCTFVGDVRLKKDCISTGVTDNIVALDKSKVINEDINFNLKGFRKLPIDPTKKKIRSM
eukprot:Tbor_TRINITY_DN2174_c0_g1::TRINITY_DN2174_c0_g1_i1::g.5498::m.5498